MKNKKQHFSVHHGLREPTPQLNHLWQTNAGNGQAKYTHSPRQTSSQYISADGIASFVHSAIPRSKDPVLLLPRSAQSASYILGLTTTSSRSSSVALHICTINHAVKAPRIVVHYGNIIAVSMPNRALGFASCLNYYPLNHSISRLPRYFN